jgi:TolB-like protein/Tfp pilus assembly protein PilF
MRRIGQFISDARRRRVLPNAALYIVAAWVTIQVADLAIEAGLIRWSLRDFFLAAFLGLPVALVISWYYDITRRGLVRTPPTGAGESAGTSLNVRDFGLITALVAAWAGAVFLFHTPPPVDRSIAVLPFENPGQDPDNAIFGFGLRVDLQTQLEKIHDLKVIARESSDRVDRDLSLTDIGNRLGAAYILRGSLERVLDRIRVNVILVDAGDESQAWAGSYDRELTAANWFDMRNEIASVITQKLRAHLSPDQRRRLDALPTENLDALQAYFRGKQRMARRTTQALSQAVRHFSTATELDPTFTLAYVGLADSRYLDMLYGGHDGEHILPQMEAAVTKALELDAGLGEAHASLAVVQRLKGRNDKALDSFQRSVELNPNYATARQWYGSTLVSVGRPEDGLIQKRKALELDPLSAVINQSIGTTLAGLGRYDDARDHYQAAIEIDPMMPGPYERMSELEHSLYGRLDEAVVLRRKGIALDPAEPMGSVMLGMLYLDLGDPDRAEQWIHRAGRLAPPGFPLAAMAMEPVYMRRGEEERAIESARKAYAMFGPSVPATLTHLRNYDLKQGNDAEARARYEEAFPAMFGEDRPKIDGRNVEVAIDMALVLSRTGEQDRAAVLLEDALAFVRTSHRLGPSGYGIADVLILAQQGKTDAAIAALSRAVDEGWRQSWWFYLEHDPSLDPLRGDPDFEALADRVRADMRSQLARVVSMEEAGELEPVPEPE